MIEHCVRPYEDDEGVEQIPRGHRVEEVEVVNGFQDNTTPRRVELNGFQDNVSSHHVKGMEVMNITSSKRTRVQVSVVTNLT